MSRVEPAKIWWTADELVEARLPDLPGTKRGINQRAEQYGWRSQPGCARPKSGRGGGWQYHWSVLPIAAQRALLRQDAPGQETRPGRGDAWAAYDALPQTAKDKAAARLEVIQQVEAFNQVGLSHVVAVNEAASRHVVSSRTIYNWLAMIDNVPIEDRLAYLVPQHRFAKREVPKDAAIRPFMDHLKSLYLRIAGQTFRQCYRKATAKAKAEGWATLTERTAARRIEKEVPRVTRVFAREGVEGLEKCFPPQMRDRSDLGALGAVNADCHKIDIFVEWPDDTINRPQIIAFQDLYSNKILSWRVDHDPNKVMVMAAFGEMIENWGIPRRCLFDNGREFANKWMTGGAPTRFRFKVRDDDPLGVLPLMGIEINWARPGRGQSKPIERAFRDLANDIAKDPRFHGAYVGNRPDAKPENYGSRAVPAETFLKVLAEGIDEHNAREGRLTDTANGRSFDQTFAESYATAPIRKATEEQRRLWMMGQQVGRLNKDNGQLRLYGNYYHSDWMSQHPGMPVVARFDPEDLHSGVSIYSREGAYLGFAECRQKVGFFDVVGAKQNARRVSRIKRAEKELVKAHAPLSPVDLAADLDARSAQPQGAELVSKVVAPTFGKTAVRLPHEQATYTPPARPDVDAARDAMVMEFKPKSDVKPAKADAPSDRFWRAKALLDKSEAGESIGTEEARWVQQYVETAEFQGMQVMFELHGKDGVG
jgi:hypothetical protein